MATYEAQVNKLVGEEHPAADVTEWMAEGLQTIVNVLPEDMLWMLEANTQEYSETDAVHGVSVGTNKILYVQRLSDDYLVDANGDGTLDAKMLVECREVSASLRGRVKAGSGWQEEASQTDPVWYKLGKRIYVEPAPIDYSQSSAVGSEFGEVIATTQASGSTSFLPNGVYTSSGAQGYEVEVTSSRQDTSDAPVTDNTIDRFKWKELPDGTYGQNVNIAMNAMYTFQYTSSDESWTSNGTDVENSYDLQVTTTGGDNAVMTFESPVISLDGSKNRFISFRLKTNDKDMNAANGHWYGRLHYKTGGDDGHTYSDAYWINFEPAANNTFETFTLDMHQLNNGGDDWKDNTITQLRFQMFAHYTPAGACTFTSGSAVVATTSTVIANIQAGEVVSTTGTQPSGIPASTTTILSIDSAANPPTFTISQNANQTGAISARFHGKDEKINIENLIIGRESYNGVLTIGSQSTNSSSNAWSDATYTNVGSTASSSGSGAKFKIIVSGGLINSIGGITVTDPGGGYAVGETITILDSELGNNSGDNLTFTVSSLYVPQGTLLSNGVHIVWTDVEGGHALGDNYEFYAEPSKRSKIYYISNPPSGWQFNSTYLDGTIPKEIDPIVLNYVAARALEQKLADIQNGTSASLEQYIIDEDIDLAQAQQVLIQDTHALIDRYTKEYQMGIQGLMSGTYAPQSTGGDKQQPAYSNVAQ